MSDPNQTAAKVVRSTIKKTEGDAIPDDLEAAWLDWSSRVQRTDERTLALLRAAFEAGAAAAKVQQGRVGGLKGGAARAASLTKKQRAAIAKKAAAARWHPKPD